LVRGKQIKEDDANIFKSLKYSKVMASELEKIKEIIAPILQQNGVEFAGVFGSVARGEDKPDSDVDLLIRFVPEKQQSLSLLGYIGLENKISQALGRKVDLIEESGLHPYVRKYVIKDLRTFYGQGRLHLLKTDPRRYHFN